MFLKYWVSFTDNSELHLKINQDCLSASPLSDEGFALVWAGVRSTYGVKSGKVAYEVKVR